VRLLSGPYLRIVGRSRVRSHAAEKIVEWPASIDLCGAVTTSTAQNAAGVRSIDWTANRPDAIGVAVFVSGGHVGGPDDGGEAGEWHWAWRVGDIAAVRAAGVGLGFRG